MQNSKLLRQTSWYACDRLAFNISNILCGRIFRKQLRRQARERRQYVYSKSLEAQQRQTFERKRKLKDALATGKALPTEMRKDAKDLGRDLAFDEAQSGEPVKNVIPGYSIQYIIYTEPTTHIDNEYSRAGVQDPKIIITTSRDPSSKLQQFAKVCRFPCHSALISLTV